MVVNELVVVVGECAHGAMHAFHPRLVELGALEGELLDQDVQRRYDFTLTTEK